MLALMMVAPALTSIAWLTVALVGLAAALTWATSKRQVLAMVVLVALLVVYATVRTEAFFLYWAHNCVWLWC